MKIGLTKKCPRCQTKMGTSIAACPNCQLNFKKFYQATNKDAKKAIKQGLRDQVLLRKGRPDDVKFITLLLLTIFLGYTGAHYYKVGRYKMGLFFTVSFIIGLANATISLIVKTGLSGELWELFTLLVLCTWGVVLIMWIVDIAKVCLNKFKIPVSRQD